MPSPAARAPDFREVRPGRDFEALEDLVRHLQSRGATWFRTTVLDDEVWVEGWITPPEAEAPFVPEPLGSRMQ